MNPIIIKQIWSRNDYPDDELYDELDLEYSLVAGERRLEACKQLNIQVPCRLLSDLTQNEIMVLEFEENNKRKKLPWREEVNAIGIIHASYLKSETSWSQSQTANILSIPESKLSNILNIFNNLDAKILTHAENLSQAISLLSRFQKTKETVISSEIKSILSTSKLFSPSEPISPSMPVSLPNISLDKEEEIIPILNCDFTKWIIFYSGPKFNFIHCDFPQSPSNFWPICNCFFGNLPKIISENAHILFWLDMNYFSEVQETIVKYKSLSYLTNPLIWNKSDTKPNQIFGNPPRNTYEAALVISHNSRNFLKPIQNIYSTPRASQPICPNQKSQPMLKYFFQNFIDENTNVFDPTCGSASALLAAEELNAKSILGLELSKDRCDKAISKLFRQREIKELTRR
jgi:hypothetical protein